MSQQVKELLDSAVADVEPRSTDPVRTVVRRARIARLRAIVISGLAVTVAVAGGLVAVRQVTGDGPAQLGAPSAEQPPPVPQVRDGRIVAGSVSLPIPQGWQVAPAGSDPCEYPPRTVRTVHVGQEPSWNQENAVCRPDLEVEGSWKATVPISYLGLAPGHAPVSVVTTGDGLTLTPKMIILRGGEPAWLDTAPLGDGTSRTRLVMPWSKVIITLHVADEVQRQIIGSITAPARRPAGLVLPDQAAYITLTEPRRGNRAADIEVVTSANEVGKVLDLLHAATVADKRGCARQGDATAQLVITTEFAPPNTGNKAAAASADVTDFSGPQLRVPPEAWQQQLTTVVISLADGCFEAVSSSGGRARLTPAAVAELETLFKARLR